MTSIAKPIPVPPRASSPSTPPADDSSLFARGPNVPLFALVVLIFAGAGVIVAYSKFVHPAPLPKATEPPSASLLLLMLFAACVFVGALVGFLFGIPRFTTAAATKPPESRPADPAKPSTLAPLAESDASATSTRDTTRRYRPSTNLDDVADWLTKIIVGLGLTQLAGLGAKIQSIGKYVSANGAVSSVDEPFVGSLVVVGAVAGFLLGYLWTRLYYAKIAARSDVDTDRTLDVELVAATTIGVGGRVTTSDAPGDAALGVAPHVDSDDENKGVFGGSAVRNGRILRAAIEPAESQPGLYRVTLAVSSLVRSAPLQGTVTFYLHRTFRERVVTRPVVDGVATLVLLAYGAFTVGATADGGTTRLELDLEQHPDATADFRSR